jgi:hypothetical protein
MADHCYAEGRFLFMVILNAIMLNVTFYLFIVILNVVMLSCVIKLSVVAPTKHSTFRQVQDSNPRL